MHAELDEVSEGKIREEELAVIVVCDRFVLVRLSDLIDFSFIENDYSVSIMTAAFDAYSEFGLKIDEFDIVFCDPWPTAEALTADIFDHCASTGFLLLTYDELTYEEKNGFLLRRKD